MKIIISTGYQNGKHTKQSFRRMRAGLRSGTFILMIILILTMSSLTVLAGTPLFQTAVGYGVGSAPYSVTVSEFNGDGHSDLAVTSPGFGGKITILLGEGDGTFHTAGTYGEGSATYCVAVGNFNDDDYSDLAVADATSGNISILSGKGDGTFQPGGSYFAGQVSMSIAVADFNTDGYLDLTTANYIDGNVSILLGEGNGSFQPAVTYSVGAAANSYLSIAVGNFNSDSFTDLVVANRTGNNVSVLLGIGNGTFQTAVSYGVGNGPYSVDVCDIDSDGYLDLAVANANSNNVSILLGNGDGTFQTVVNYSAGNGPYSVAMDDIDSDGYPDLAVANFASNNVSVLLGNGDGTFQTAMNYSTGIFPYSVTTGDFNDDGHPDLATANIFNSEISILLNNIMLTGLELTATIPDLTAGGSVYDLDNLAITGLNQLGKPIGIDGLAVTWDCSGITGSLLGDHYLVPLFPGDGGAVTATINGITSNSHSFKVLPAVNNADLSALTVMPGSISAFFPDTVTYAVYGSNTPASLIVTATADDNRSELTISGQIAHSGIPLTVQLDNGANLIPIVVTAADAQTQRAYVLSVNGTVSDADLDSLSVSTGDIDFSPSNVGYSQMVDTNTDHLTVSASSHDPKALVFLDGSPMQSGVPKTVDLAYGDNSIDVMVVAQDAATKTYTIDVTRGQPLISWDTGSLQATDISTTGLTLTWPVASCDAGISGYKVYQGESLLSTVTASVYSYNVAGLTMGTAYDFSIKAVDQAGNLSSSLTLSVSTNSGLKITADTLPGATVNQPYSTTLEASGGKSPYTWSATGLPPGLILDSAIGAITGTPAAAGTSVVNVTLTDSLGITSSKGFTISVFYPAGTGQYIVAPPSDTAYTTGTTPEGITTMTVNSGVSGFKYFMVNIATVQSHTGNEVAVFVQMRSGVQIAINATKTDFDQVNSAMAAFNVQPGDIIKVYIVDDLTNDAGSNPALLQ